MPDARCLMPSMPDYYFIRLMRYYLRDAFHYFVDAMMMLMMFFFRCC